MRTPDEPFALPRGSVRALLTVLLVGITAGIMFIPVPAGKDDVKSMFVLLTGIAVRDYFASREHASTGAAPGARRDSVVSAPREELQPAAG